MTGRAKHPGQKKDRPRGVQARRTSDSARGPKGAGALVCRDCGVVQHRGKWSWGKPPLTQLHSVRCPACTRIRDRRPAGIVQVPSDFLGQREELLNLALNVEEAEKAEHPLERLMKTQESKSRLVIHTTGVHLARQIAHKLARHFHRKPRMRYADGESYVEVDWP
jgi:NMD protein affecting ribosome stability and mRNA decay